MPDLVIANEAVFLKEQLLEDLPSLLLKMIYLVDMLSFFVLGPMLLALPSWDLTDWGGKLLKAITGVGMVVALGGVERRDGAHCVFLRRKMLPGRGRRILDFLRRSVCRGGSRNDGPGATRHNCVQPEAVRCRWN